MVKGQSIVLAQDGTFIGIEIGDAGYSNRRTADKIQAKKHKTKPGTETGLG